MDPHTDTGASGGVCRPSEIFHLAVGRGLSAIAPTHHDTLGRVAEARRVTGTALGVRAGVEIDAEEESGGLHFLGYRFTGLHGPACFPRLQVKPQEAILMILDTGDVSPMTHPGHSGPAVVEAGPDFAAWKSAERVVNRGYC